MTGLTYSPECSDSEAPGPDSYVLMSTLLNMGGDRGGGAGVCLRSCDGMFWSHCTGSFFKAVIDSHHGVNKPFKLSMGFMSNLWNSRTNSIIDGVEYKNISLKICSIQFWVLGFVCLK